MNTVALIDALYQNENLSDHELLFLLENIKEEEKTYLFKKSLDKKTLHYGNTVFMRGLIEFSNYCKQDCMYCGIRRSNHKADRYRLSKESILHCCEEGYQLGYRTFVLQGGEDPYFTDERLIDIVTAIKKAFPQCAITLSIGERDAESYKRLKDAGVDRYLLRHETASKALYTKLHPHMSIDNRIECLYTLKGLGYQVGAGFMVGLPGQTLKDYVADLRFLKELSPEMVGIGPYIPHEDTPLKGHPSGKVDDAALLIAIVRLLLPKALLPATTAMGTLSPQGRERALRAGANVVMPNLSPLNVREKYALYQDKICTGDEAAHCRACIEGRIKKAGFTADMSRGDHKNHQAYPETCISNKTLFKTL